MTTEKLRTALANLLNPSSLLAIMLTIGVISMIMFTVEPPQWYVIIWSMSVGYFFKGMRVETQLQNGSQNVRGLK